MSLADDLRAQITEETGLWGGGDPVVLVMLRALAVIEAVEKLPDPWATSFSDLHAAVEKLKEMVRSRERRR